MIHSSMLRAMIGILILAALVTSACGSEYAGINHEPTTSAPSQAPADSYVGAVEGTDAYVALLVAHDGSAGAYVCDGTADRPAAVAAPLVGRISNGALDLQPAKGVAVSGALSGSNVSGEISMAGTSHPFLASRAAPPAGLYQASDNDSGGHRARWVVLADGTYRGALFQGGGLTPAPPPPPGRGVGGVGLVFTFYQYVYFPPR
ncbi:MAG: hypothetical protein QOJ19_958 [Acidimicrobiia bacterium]|nr:hypothetical protein [Acidimicrobiia bacterium]